MTEHPLHPLHAPRWDVYNAANTGRGPRELTLRAVEALLGVQVSVGGTPEVAQDRGSYGAALGGPGTVAPGAPPVVSGSRPVAPGPGAVAVELGSGSGVDARYLESLGLAVHSYDADPTSSGGSRHRVVDLSEIATLPDEAAPAIGRCAVPPSAALPFTPGPSAVLPAAALVLSNSTLSFLEPPIARGVVTSAARALAPGGVLAIDFFGPWDDWAGGPGTYPSVDEVHGWLVDATGTARATDGPWSSLDITEREWDGQGYSGHKHWHVITVLGRR